MSANILRLLLTAGLIIVVFAGCGKILVEDADITGVVRLSDNPQTGHGGVLVSNGFAQTTTIYDGHFTLSGKIIKDREFDVFFSKAGYVTQSRHIKLDYNAETGTGESKDLVVDVGTITLSVSSQ